MYTPLHRAASSTGGSFLGMSSEEESKWMERRRKVLKKLRGKKMSRRGGTQWIDTTSTTTTSSSPEGSKRSSVGSEAAGSRCSWDPSTEQAINIGLMGYEAAIIEEAEEEEQAETEIESEQESRLVEPVEEPHPVHDLSSEAPLEIMGDTKSEFGYTDSESFISRDDSFLETSSSTDFEGTMDGQSMVEVKFDHVDRFDSRDDRTISDRSSYSSIGSGYDAVVDYHEVFFSNIAEKMASGASMSESTLGLQD